MDLILIWTNSDVAARWNPVSSNDPSGHLPDNVLDHLAKVANVSGQLTFERFCAGLKIAILRHEANRNKIATEAKENGVSVIIIIINN